MSKRYCLTLNLKDDPVLIQQYKEHHNAVWPEIVQSIKGAGILNMEIYCLGNRLCMIMDTEEDFSFERKQTLDADNSKVAEWEDLMWRYQEPLSQAAPGVKWVLMEKIFDLTQS